MQRLSSLSTSREPSSKQLSRKVLSARHSVSALITRYVTNRMAGGKEAHVDWKHLAIYGAVVAIVVVIGVVAIWSFIQRQSLVLQAEPLPKITIVTADPNSRLAASWVRMLTSAEIAPTLVPLETFDPIEGVVVFCDIPDIPPRLAELLDQFVKSGGALAFAGKPPRTRIGSLRLIADGGLSDAAIRMGENASPVLARLNPGHQVAMRRVPVAFLKESPRMVVDARWANNARAAVVHVEDKGARYLWFGIDPDAVVQDDVQLKVMLKTAFRWVSGQPVSDGAIGEEQVAKTLTMAARRDARNNDFAFSVDRSTKPDMFTVRLINRGGRRIANPTVKIWLPTGVTQVALGGDLIMRRNATLTGVPEEGACLITVPSLTRNEERVLKLMIKATRPRQALPLAVSR